MAFVYMASTSTLRILWFITLVDQSEPPVAIGFYPCRPIRPYRPVEPAHEEEAEGEPVRAEHRAVVVQAQKHNNKVQVESTLISFSQSNFESVVLSSRGRAQKHNKGSS